MRLLFYNSPPEYSILLSSCLPKSVFALIITLVKYSSILKKNKKNKNSSIEGLIDPREVV